MASETTFQTAMSRVLLMEGGYSNDPNDPGGETNFGISKRSYPDRDIANLSQADAVAIYREDFWQKTQIVSLADAVAGAAFDLAVNMGAKAGIKIVQRAISFAGTTIVDDGVIGPATMRASFAVDPVKVIALIRWQACLHYLAIVDGRPASRRYLDGWLRRACALV